MLLLAVSCTHGCEILSGVPIASLAGTTSYMTCSNVYKLYFNRVDIYLEYPYYRLEGT